MSRYAVTSSGGPLSEDEVENELMGDAFSLRVTGDGVCLLELAPDAHVDDVVASMITRGIERLIGDDTCGLVLDLAKVPSVSLTARKLTVKLTSAPWLYAMAIVGESNVAVGAVDMLVRSTSVTIPVRLFSRVEDALTWVQDPALRTIKAPVRTSDLSWRDNGGLLLTEDEILAKKADLGEIALDAVNMGAWYWNLQTGHVDRDDRALSLMGLTRAEMPVTLDESLTVIVAEDRELFLEAANRAIRNKTDLEVTLRIHHPAGGIRYFGVRGRIFYDSGGEPEVAIGVLWDRTSEAPPLESERNRALETANAELRRLNIILEKSATTDGLTGVLNRQAILEVLDREIERSKRYQSPLTVAVVDLDELKPINDTHGHLTGDAVLRAVAMTLVDQARRSDAVGRYGGDEFLVVLPNTTLEQASPLSDRIREALRSGQFQDVPQGVEVRCSIGFAQGTEATSPRDLVARADEAMYEQKRSGGRGR